jgi:hypothetical protein
MCEQAFTRERVYYDALISFRSAVLRHAHRIRLFRGECTGTVMFGMCFLECPGRLHGSGSGWLTSQFVSDFQTGGKCVCKLEGNLMHAREVS